VSQYGEDINSISCDKTFFASPVKFG